MGTADGLEALFSFGLPVSREERFYTATVLPALISRDGFSGFEVFRDAVAAATSASGLDAPEIATSVITATGPETNVQLLTEFDLWKALTESGAKARFPDAPAIRAVPDLAIYVQGSSPVLIVVEAKMFLYYTAAQLSKQMADQQILMEYVAGQIASATGAPLPLVQVALLPAARVAGDSYAAFPYPIVTWESLRDGYAGHDASQYWVRVLDIALSRWKHLASSPTSFGENADDKATGQEIFNAALAGRLIYPVVGRRGGLSGKEFSADVASGAWKQREYELALDVDLAHQANWFTVAEFVAAVAEAGGRP